MFQLRKMYRQKTPKAIIIMMTTSKSLCCISFSIHFDSNIFSRSLFSNNKTRKENNDHVTFYVLSWCEVGARELVKCRNAFLPRLGFKPPTLKGNLWLNGCLNSKLRRKPVGGRIKRIIQYDTPRVRLIVDVHPRPLCTPQTQRGSQYILCLFNRNRHRTRIKNNQNFWIPQLLNS